MEQAVEVVRNLPADLHEAGKPHAEADCSQFVGRDMLG